MEKELRPYQPESEKEAKPNPIPEFDSSRVFKYIVGDQVVMREDEDEEEILTVVDIISVPPGHQKFVRHTQRVRLKSKYGFVGEWMSAALIRSIETENIIRIPRNTDYALAEPIEDKENKTLFPEADETE